MPLKFFQIWNVLIKILNSCREKLLYRQINGCLYVKHKCCSKFILSRNKTKNQRINQVVKYAFGRFLQHVIIRGLCPDTFVKEQQFR